ncbi:MAG TPA: hypothetical protein VGM52_03150 [Herbaspirillum sp.]
MDQDIVAAEIQALLASLKSSLAGGSNNAGSTSPASAASAGTDGYSQPADLLPSPRSLRRFLLMI